MIASAMEGAQEERALMYSCVPSQELPAAKHSDACAGTIVNAQTTPLQPSRSASIETSVPVSPSSLVHTGYSAPRSCYRPVEPRE